MFFRLDSCQMKPFQGSHPALTRRETKRIIVVYSNS